jgi:hypothetical protein
MKRTAIAKSRQLDRASVAIWRIGGVHVDCGRAAGSAKPTEERNRPTAVRQDKRREVRTDRTVEDRKPINNFVRGALWHRTSSLRASYWKNETTCTLRASTWCTGTVDRSVAPRTILPFCPGQALWHSAAMDCPRVRYMSIAPSPLGCALDPIAEGRS